MIRMTLYFQHFYLCIYFIRSSNCHFVKLKCFYISALEVIFLYPFALKLWSDVSCILTFDSLLRVQLYVRNTVKDKCTFCLFVCLVNTCILCYHLMNNIQIKAFLLQAFSGQVTFSK